MRSLGRFGLCLAAVWLLLPAHAAAPSEAEIRARLSATALGPRVEFHPGDTLILITKRVALPKKVRRATQLQVTLRNIETPRGFGVDRAPERISLTQSATVTWMQAQIAIYAQPGNRTPGGPIRFDLKVADRKKPKRVFLEQSVRIEAALNRAPTAAAMLEVDFYGYRFYKTRALRLQKQLRRMRVKASLDPREPLPSLRRLSPARVRRLRAFGRLRRRMDTAKRHLIAATQDSDPNTMAVAMAFLENLDRKTRKLSGMPTAAMLSAPPKAPPIAEADLEDEAKTHPSGIAPHQDRAPPTILAGQNSPKAATMPATPIAEITLKLRYAPDLSPDLPAHSALMHLSAGFWLSPRFRLGLALQAGLLSPVDHRHTHALREGARFLAQNPSLSARYALIHEKERRWGLGARLGLPLMPSPGRPSAAKPRTKDRRDIPVPVAHYLAALAFDDPAIATPGALSLSLQSDLTLEFGGLRLGAALAGDFLFQARGISLPFYLNLRPELQLAYAFTPRFWMGASSTSSTLLFLKGPRSELSAKLEAGYRFDAIDVHAGVGTFFGPSAEFTPLFIEAGLRVRLGRRTP